LHVVQFGFFVPEAQAPTGDSQVDELWNDTGSQPGREEEEEEHFAISNFPLPW
jgi:hypothetical protein